MKPVKIITDSCSDLTGELLEKYNIDYAKMRYTYGGTEKEAILTWSEEAIHELYNVMRGACRNVALTCAYAVFYDSNVKLC